MSSNHQSSERGQAILLIVLAMVVLLGFAALAVDGSMVYSDRRYAQSIADSASLAGGAIAAKVIEDNGINYDSWTAAPPKCSGKVAEAAKAGVQAAIKRAGTNNVTIDDKVDDKTGVEAICGADDIFATTSSGKPVKIFTDQYIDIVSTITQETQTAFAHFVTDGPLMNTSSAVARVRPRQPLAYGFAIVALNPAACKGNTNGIQYRGNNLLTVSGGGIWSNGCMDMDGNPSVTVTNGPVIYFSSANNNTLGKIKMVPSGAPAQLKNATDRIPEDAYDVTAPNCTSANKMTGEEFTGYWAKHGKPIPEGLWCIDGDISMTNKKDYVEAFGVTLYITGDVKITGGVAKLTAPPAGYVGQAIPNVVIYAPKSNTSEWKITGNSGSYFQGTILAPKVSIDIVGNSVQEAFNSQIIAWDVNMGGTSDTAVVYNHKNQFSQPTTLDVQR